MESEDDALEHSPNRSVLLTSYSINTAIPNQLSIRPIDELQYQHGYTEPAIDPFYIRVTVLTRLYRTGYRSVLYTSYSINTAIANQLSIHPIYELQYQHGYTEPAVGPSYIRVRVSTRLYRTG
ncbi:hypothetical protein PoB_001572200 [Plakobranchus ocellatus]|uniref:Uncharacterized protein n=1 Tax=Plakobranchus ocellatus TaxID=259542 RepID=A0AAV3Z3T0_9GAST|nr:hypothetical protein PoB_001572200 [Plakobranchus ocellatus]